MTLNSFSGGAAILAAAVSMSACIVEAQRVEGSFQKTLTVGDRPTVEIISGSGAIEVRQGAVGRVEVRARIRAGDWGWSRSGLSAQERVKRIEANPPVEQQGNAVRIGDIKDADLRDGVSISYDVTVPPGSSLQSKSGSGSQRIEGVDGDVVVSSGSGSLTVRRSGGTRAREHRLRRHHRRRRRRRVRGLDRERLDRRDWRQGTDYGPHQQRQHRGHTDRRR